MNDSVFYFDIIVILFEKYPNEKNNNLLCSDFFNFL